MKRIEKGICGICPESCGVEIVLDNDRIGEIHPWKEHPKGIPCIRGQHAPEIIYSSDRLKKPLKRKGPKGTLEFKEVSWEQALDEIATVILKLKSEYGPQCIASFFGRGNFEQSLWRMFTPDEDGFLVGNSIFMPLGSPNAFSVGSLCYIAHGAIAPVTTYGAPLGILQPDLERTEIIFFWGTNPAVSSSLNEIIPIQKAKRRGAKIVVIDPRKTATAKIADLWVPIKPGTDGALIYGILYQCFKKGRIDREFGEKFCEGFFELEEYINLFHPEYVKNITRVTENNLFELSEIFGSNKKITFFTYSGLEYSKFGVQTLRALLTLWALTGHLDVEGGQRFQFPVHSQFQKPKVKFPTEVPPIGMDKYPLFCQLTKNGHFMEFPRSVLANDPYKIRFLLIGGASILTNFPDTALFTRAIKALDYVVSVDRFLTADALYADMVLPATTYFEITSLCGYPNETPFPAAIQFRKKIIEPVGEAMNDYLIYARLAERLGYGHLYPQTEEEMIKYVIAEMPFTLEEFKNRSQEGPILLSEVTPEPGREKKWISGGLRRDGKPGFPTPSGKWEISSSILKNYGHNPFPFPAYLELTEDLQDKALKKYYPLTLITGARINSAFRSQHLNIPGLLKYQPEAEVLIHPDDARVRNISTGDKVKVKTPKGEVRFIARVTNDILPGVIEVNEGGGSPIQPEGWRESNVNFLTDADIRDPISGFPVFRALRGEVEKI